MATSFHYCTQDQPRNNPGCHPSRASPANPQLAGTSMCLRTLQVHPVTQSATIVCGAGEGAAQTSSGPFAHSLVTLLARPRAAAAAAAAKQHRRSVPWRAS
jgi:hypothetical protein